MQQNYKSAIEELCIPDWCSSLSNRDNFFPNLNKATIKKVKAVNGGITVLIEENGHEFSKTILIKDNTITQELTIKLEKSIGLTVNEVN